MMAVYGCVSTWDRQSDAMEGDDTDRDGQIPVMEFQFAGSQHVPTRDAGVVERKNVRFIH